MGGKCIIRKKIDYIVYADVFIAGFGDKEEAERYYEELIKRLEKIGLEIEMSKTKENEPMVEEKPSNTTKNADTEA